MAKKAAKEKETPLMKQYNAVKAKHPGALLLFRVGDFYETFGEDAIKASRILNITLTKRANGAASHVELAGFPYHALDNYLPKLVRAGERVAVCDQLEDPKTAKGIVKRGVTELVTPGVSMNDNVLEAHRNNYLASLYFRKDSVGLALLDISTGEFMAAQGTHSYVDKLLQSLAPTEVIYCKQQKIEADAFKLDCSQFALDDWIYTDEFAEEKLTSHFKTTTLKGFGIDGLDEGIIAAGAILQYLEITEHREISHISAISRIEEENHVWLDRFTVRNLELLFPQHEGGVPLISVLDRSTTPMGARHMRKWIALPLKSKKQIQDRLDMVATLVEDQDLLEEVQMLMKPIGDLERLISKVAAGRINPRELVQLKRALQQIQPLKARLAEQKLLQMQIIAERLNSCEVLVNKIESDLQENPPALPNQGGLINDGVHPELDELRKIAFSGKDYLLEIQRNESERTGIPSLKVAYNKVFGYYLEVRNVHKDKVPPEWIRKQTLTNAERYITEELKTYEEKILNAEEQIQIIELRLFNELVAAAMEYIKPIQQNATVLATLDCLSSFATVAIQNRYCRPQVTDGTDIRIKDGRHPVIEQQLPPGEAYVPNDITLDDEEQILIITGPNMAGKSALLRQTALITLMAQVGSFVPAKDAEIGLVDKIFTRVGASDNLSRGESTFMVEMTETASILNNLSERSLVLMDEIGRGTSTYDGISIAWAIVEHLHNHPRARAKTLFATHYHELNQLAEDLGRIRNYNVSVKEMGGKVVFLRKLKSGGSEHSFGINVAQMAGMPNPVVIRAGQILVQLEKDKIKDARKKRIQEIPKVNYQLNLFEAKDPHYEKVKETLQSLDINTISPVEALLKLNEMKELMK